MMEHCVAEQESPLVIFLKNYIKHPTLEVELTLKNGEKITLKDRRSFDGEIITYFIKKSNAKQNQRNVSLSEILKAEVFSV